MIDRDALLETLSGRAWAIDRDRLDALLAAVALGRSLESVQAARAGRTVRAQSRGVGVVPIVGVIDHRESWFSALFGGTSTERIGNELDALVYDKTIDGIILDVDSPGGSVDGVMELAAAIRAARKRKPVVAVANAMAASAGYWLASQADTLFVTPSGWVGSIGVFMVHADLSGALSKAGIGLEYVAAGKYKTEVNETKPLDKSSRAYIQGMVDSHYTDFVDDVARGRGVPVSRVRTGYGEGRMLTATAAKSAGLVDDVRALSGVLAAPPSAGIRSTADYTARARARQPDGPPTSWYAARSAARDRNAGRRRPPTPP